VAEARDLVGGLPGGEPQPVRPRTEADARPAQVSDDPKERRRAEALRKAALMKQLSSEAKVRVARGEITLAEALREAGLDPSELD
jgi:hypothetical protein